MTDLLNEIKWNKQGLLPVIAQDQQSKAILMMAWMNKEAFNETIETMQAVYYSRSRQRLWKKGESSGHIQQVKEILLDCDGDTLLLVVEQIGGISCHTGRTTCFFKRLEGDAWQSVVKIKKSPKDIYGE